MSQWGKTLEINGAVFMPSIGTTAFQATGPSSLIEDIILVDNGGSKDNADKQLALLKKELIGMNYCVWGWMLELKAANSLRGLEPIAYFKALASSKKHQ